MIANNNTQHSTTVTQHCSEDNKQQQQLAQSFELEEFLRYVD